MSIPARELGMILEDIFLRGGDKIVGVLDDGTYFGLKESDDMSTVDICICDLSWETKDVLYSVELENEDINWDEIAQTVLDSLHNMDKTIVALYDEATEEDNYDGYDENTMTTTKFNQLVAETVAEINEDAETCVCVNCNKELDADVCEKIKAECDGKIICPDCVEKYQKLYAAIMQK
jgi:hypothetical protein